MQELSNKLKASCIDCNECGYEEGNFICEKCNIGQVIKELDKNMKEVTVEICLERYTELVKKEALLEMLLEQREIKVYLDNKGGV